MANEAYQRGDLPIAAIVLDKENNIVGTGQNRIRTAGRLHHAEIEALSEAGRHGSILITTLEPCPMCVGAAKISGISIIIYGTKDNMLKEAYSNNPYVIKDFSLSRITDTLCLPNKIHKG
jgi:tRNA(Ile)-lysidine synthase